MIRLVAGRLATGAALLVLLSLLVFVGVDLLPGDAANARLGASATPARLAETRQRLGLDRPVLVRYADWAGGLLRGDLGTSVSGTPVSAILGGRVANSALLAGLTTILLVPISLVVGMWAGLRPGSRRDRGVAVASLLFVAAPEFVTAGLLVLVFAIGLGVLPAVSLIPPGAGPLDRPAALVLPVLALLLLHASYAVRMIRATIAATVRAPHVEFARLNGEPPRDVVRHAVLPAVLPVALQVWLLTAAALVGGTVLVERVFGYPGIGEVLVTAVRTGDLPVAQALVMVLGAGVVVALLAADVGVRLSTPTLRTAEQPAPVAFR
ncbi:metal transporter [Pseudonocardia sulfidoxydans NBRC 16205]|uniref:Metal transporter n=1 Tax=Pseudonocardia sulfidoxydans NBRC 16205 TaxID=1223511 RepID=A0A511DJ91_9PSEU|nr:ABC transporter permease [Pseudonocardia sulfidoxydans]GEL23098.1 metal transporter [Pseudonocardia sulfidoxydans NBRC 16205]